MNPRRDPRPRAPVLEPSLFPIRPRAAAEMDIVRVLDAASLLPLDAACRTSRLSSPELDASKLGVAQCRVDQQDRSAIYPPV
jgi:hypothetical protein